MEDYVRFAFYRKIPCSMTNRDVGFITVVGEPHFLAAVYKGTMGTELYYQAKELTPKRKMMQK